LFEDKHLCRRRQEIFIEDARPVKGADTGAYQGLEDGERRSESSSVTTWKNLDFCLEVLCHGRLPELLSGVADKGRRSDHAPSGSKDRNV
jgi:hypothetical protein